MKSKRILMVFVAIVLLVTAITVPVAAYMIKKTGSFESNFTPSTVECKVNETFENLVKESITVTNLGDIDAYVRVKLVTYYVDEDGNVLANNVYMLRIRLFFDLAEGDFVLGSVINGDDIIILFIVGLDVFYIQNVVLVDKIPNAVFEIINACLILHFHFICSFIS